MRPADQPLAVRSEFERLLRFIFSPGQPFGLLVACLDNEQRAAELRASAVAEARTAGVAVLELDAETLSHTENPVKHLVDTVRASEAAVLFLVAADHLSDGDARPARALNFARDRLPEQIPARIVLWMTLEGRTRLARVAPDLSNVILSTLVFPSSPSESHPEPLLHRFQGGQSWRSRRGSTDTALRAAERELLHRLLDDPDTSPAARLDIGLRIAEIDAELGESNRAISRALELADSAEEAKLLAGTIEALKLAADIAFRVGRATEALRWRLRAHALLDQLSAESLPEASLLGQYAQSRGELGDIYRALGQGEQARKAYAADLEIAKRLAAQEPDRADYQRDLSVSYERMGDLYRALGQGEQARKAYAESLDIRQRLAAQEPDRADYQRDLATSFERMAECEESNARDWLEKALAIRHAALQLEPHDVIVARELAIALIQFAQVAQSKPALQQGAAILIELKRIGALEADYLPLANELEARFGNGKSPPET